jgi:hypothetical protein
MNEIAPEKRAREEDSYCLILSLSRGSLSRRRGIVESHFSVAKTKTNKAAVAVVLKRRKINEEKLITVNCRNLSSLSYAAAAAAEMYE